MPNYVNVPGLSGLKDMASAFKQSVDPLDVLLGVGVGMVAGAVAKQVVDAKLTVAAEGKAPMLDPSKGIGKFVSQWSAELGSLLAGGVAYAVQKGNKRGAGHLVGAVGAAVVPTLARKVSGFVLTNVPGLKGYGNYVMSPYGVIYNDGSYGVIANDATYGNYVMSPELGMAELRTVSHQIGETEGGDEYTV